MTSSRQTAGLPAPVAEKLRLELDRELRTTLHVLRLPRTHYTARVAVLEPPAPLAAWCAANETDHAVIGGFYIRAEEIPLGHLRVDGRALPSIPFDPPWDRARACVHAENGKVALRFPFELPEGPGGDLLQAGPMLARAGACLVEPGIDPEGFSAGSRQFDSDITAGRFPRAALGLGATELIAVVSEGRTDGEAGLTLAELARAMIDLGAPDAINLDGGGSASLVVGGELVNDPHEDSDLPIPGGRAISTALRFVPR